jgi:hypothetical protein
MNFDTFLSEFYSSYRLNNHGQRMGQFFMNELSKVDLYLYRSIPADIDPFHNDKMLDSCVDWVSDRWSYNEAELILRAIQNGADADFL